MSTYSLSQTGTEINSAIGKVHNADTSPTQGSTNMVTSGGVFTAINDIGISSLPITTKAQGIANYDNDEKVPTNAAVKDLAFSIAETKLVIARQGKNIGLGAGYDSTGELKMNAPSTSAYAAPDKAIGITYSTTEKRTNVTIPQGTYYSIHVVASVNVGGSDGSPAQKYQIRDGSTVLKEKIDSSSYNDNDIIILYNPSDIFYAPSGKNYSFNTYWIEGDSTGLDFNYMYVTITAYQQKPIVTVS